PAATSPLGFEMPVVRGLTVGITPPTDIPTLTDELGFEVESIFMLDPVTQRWLIYSAAAPAFVNSLTSASLSEGGAVWVRRGAPPARSDGNAPSSPGASDQNQSPTVGPEWIGPEGGRIVDAALGIVI